MTAQAFFAFLLQVNIWEMVQHNGPLGMVVLAICLAAINQIFSMLDPQIFRIIVDRYASHIDTIPRAEFIKGVGLMILAFIGVAMVSRIAKNFQDYYVNVVSQSALDGMYHVLP